MTWIEFHGSLASEVRKQYRLWGNDQPKEPNQLGGKSWMDVTDGPDTQGMVSMLVPTEFVTRLEGSGLPVKRR